MWLIKVLICALTVLTHPLDLLSKWHVIEITQSSVGIRESSWETHSQTLSVCKHMSLHETQMVMVS